MIDREEREEKDETRRGRMRDRQIGEREVR